VVSGWEPIVCGLVGCVYFGSGYVGTSTLGEGGG